MSACGAAAQQHGTHLGTFAFASARAVQARLLRPSIRPRLRYAPPEGRKMRDDA